MDAAVDLTLSHRWQASERSPMSRERWRTFLCRKERLKHSTYDAVCATAGWGFQACAFGTWGGLGPEGAKLSARVAKRAGAWHLASHSATTAAQGRQAIGVAL